MSDALTNPRHRRPNRIITNDGWSKPILNKIAEDTGASQQEVVRNVLRKGLRAMGYGEAPADSPSAGDTEKPPLGPSHFITEQSEEGGATVRRAVGVCTADFPCEECAAGHA